MHRPCRLACSRSGTELSRQTSAAPAANTLPSVVVHGLGDESGGLGMDCSALNPDAARRDRTCSQTMRDHSFQIRHARLLQ